ncbi:MAG: hypothetical protein K9H84_01360 [Bacteroidales bacterium]|nr:hypothetical protein [Bacteroidales bacterium]
MKKFVLLALTAIFIMGTFNAFASSKKDLFEYDEEAVNEEFAELSKLETHVSKTNSTYSMLEVTDNSLIANVSASPDLMNYYRRGKPPLGIPSFVWGFCLSATGIGVVYFVTEDTDETKKALWGCLAGGAVYALAYVAYVSWIVSSASAI